MSIRRAVAMVSLFFLVAATPQPRIPQLGETMEVSIINVDVFVTDKAGNRVRGLTREDFEIYENGKLQPISNFAEYTSAVTAGETAVEGTTAAEAAQRQPRTVVVFLERMRLLPHNADPFFASIKQFLATAVGPEDSVSLVYWNPLTAKQLEFTNDLTAINQGLDAIAATAKGVQLEDIAQNHEHAEMVREFEAEVEAMAARGGMGQFAVGTSGLDNSAATQLPMLSAFAEMKRRVHAINSTIATMGAGEGKKILLLATRRLGEVAGAEYAYAAGATTVTHGMKQRYGTESLMKSLIANANANGVTIYPLFASSLGIVLQDATTNFTMPAGVENHTLLNETVNLAEIAEQTGGLAAYAVADIVKLMPQISADVTEYYSLAYKVTAKREDRARDITVKVKNPNLRVRNRDQFVEKSDDTRMKDRLTAALFSTRSDSQIAITATLGERKQVRKRATIPVSVQIPIAALTTLPQDGGKHAGAFSIYIASAADLDELSEFTEKTQPFEIKTADMQKAQTGHFSYSFDVVVNDKVRYVAVGVLDEISKSYGVTRLDVKSAHEPQHAAR